ncbi:hypothetical protein M758_UG110000 [Ceratodon purpureus]|nr:hypothetical protein M758_UG110000 [Ceratodon purpureus]
MTVTQVHHERSELLPLLLLSLELQTPTLNPIPLLLGKKKKFGHRVSKSSIKHIMRLAPKEIL